MNRREFLKAIGVTLLTSQIPIGIAEAYPHFDPTKQYGSFLEVTDFIDKAVLAELQHMLSDQIAFCIPPKYRSGISWIVQQPYSSGDHNYRGSIAWKYSPIVREEIV